MFKLDKKIWSSCVSNQGQFELFLLLKTLLKENVLMMATLSLSRPGSPSDICQVQLSRDSEENLGSRVTHYHDWSHIVPHKITAQPPLVQLLRDYIIQSKLYWKVGRPFITVFIFDNGGTLVLGFALYQICSGKRRKISADKISCQVCL